MEKAVDLKRRFPDEFWKPTVGVNKDKETLARICGVLPKNKTKTELINALDKFDPDKAKVEAKIEELRCKISETESNELHPIIAETRETQDFLDESPSDDDEE